VSIDRLFASVASLTVARGFNDTYGAILWQTALCDPPTDQLPRKIFVHSSTLTLTE